MGETGVIFENITVEHYNFAYPECYLAGAIHGASWTFINDVFQFNNCTGLNIGAGGHVIGGRYSDNMHAGIGGYLSHGVVIQGAEIARNNARHDDIGNDAAGLKMATSDSVQLLNNYVHDNYSQGLWADIACSNWLIDGNTVVGNQGSGIKYEISLGATTIRNNVVNDNGTQLDLGESSQGLDVYGNNLWVGDGQTGWFVQAEVRTIDAGGPPLVTQNILGCTTTPRDLRRPGTPRGDVGTGTAGGTGGIYGFLEECVGADRAGDCCRQEPLLRRVAVRSALEVAELLWRWMDSARFYGLSGSEHGGQEANSTVQVRKRKARLS